MWTTPHAIKMTMFCALSKIINQHFFLNLFLFNMIILKQIDPFHNTSAPARLRLPVPHVLTNH